MINTVFAAYLVVCALSLLFLLTSRKRRSYLGIFLLASCAFPVVYFTSVVADRDTIIINEVCSNNFSIAQNSDGRYTDYIELYNAGDSDVSLLGWTFYTENELEEYYEFGNIILQPGAFLLLSYHPDAENFMSRKHSMTVASGTYELLEIPCAVSREGETLYLCNSAGKTADAIDVPAMKYDTVYARSADKNWELYTPTPGADNLFGIALDANSFDTASAVPETAFTPSALPSPEYSDFVVLSLSIPENALYGTDGIFLTENLDLKGRIAERECRIDVYSPGLNYEFSQNAGIRVSGRTDNLSHLDFNIYARDIYEKRTVFEFDFLNENLYLDKLELKSNATQEHLLIQLLNQHQMTGLSSIPCVLFLNGEFYGEYYMMQPLEEDLIADTNSIALKDLTLISDGQLAYGSDYSLHEYRSLLKEAASLDFTKQKNYDYISNYLNMESLVNYYAVQIYFNNYGITPYKNSLVWKSEVPDSSNLAADGKWHYEITGLSSTLENNLYHSGSDTNTSKELLAKDELLKALLPNDDFYQTLSDRLNQLSEYEFEETQIETFLSSTSFFRESSQDLLSDFQAFFTKRPVWLLSDLEKTRDFVLDEISE